MKKDNPMRKYLSLFVMFLLCQYSRGSLVDAYQIYVTAGANDIIGRNAKLTLNMKNRNAIASWKCDLVLPDGVTFLSANISSRRYPEGYNAELTTTTNDDGTITIQCRGAESVAMTGTDGEIATVTVDIASTDTDDYTVTVRNTKLTESNETIHNDPIERSMTWTQLRNGLYLTGPNAKPGQTVELTLNLINADPVAEWACFLDIPEGISLKQVSLVPDRYPVDEDDDPLYVIYRQTASDGSIMIVASSNTTSNTILGNDGPVATISISVPGDYVFGDYNIELKKISIASPDGVSLPVNETSTFTLKVVDPDASTLIFDSNGGSAIDSITQKNGSTITPPANPTREGYTFLGWEPAIPETMPEGGLTVTAQWQINQHTATFTIPSENWTQVLTQDYGSAITAPTPPEKPGFTFVGWDKPVPETMPDNDLVFIGSYTQNMQVLTLTASGNGAISYGNTSVRSSSQSFDVAELSEVVLTVTPDAGYHVETLTINGEDALSQLTDGKLSIGSITSSVTVDVTFAVNSDNAMYEAALKAYPTGAYYITTEVNGIKYYVNAQGELVKRTKYDEMSDGLFTINQVDGGAYANIGWQIEGANGHFSNTTLIDSKANLHPGTGKFRLDDSNNRNDWESQVFFLNADGKIAIRSCNTAYGESSWADAGRTFWTYEVDEAGEVVYGDNGSLIPCYSYEPAYIWTLETSINLQILTLAASGNGVISYGNTFVRSSSQSFDVAELSEVVLTITPDAGHHVETLTINGEDALSELTDGKLSIGSMTSSVTVAVTFAANVIDFADANVKAICVANWDTNGDEELSYDEAAAVTDLGEVFKDNETITSFNELQYFTGLTSISDYAFNECSGLTSIVIPNSIISIGAYAFAYCSGLKSVTFGNVVTSIGVSAFEACSDLTSVTIPNSVTSIGHYAFSGCHSLTSITIPENVTSIGSFVISGRNLTSINVETGNKTYDSRNNCNAIIETATNRLISGCKGTVIPNSVTCIGWGAFYSSNLTAITIPSSVTSIENYAFKYCEALTSVIIPKTVTNMGKGVFGGCNYLTSIKVETGNDNYDSREDCNAIIETASNTLIAGCKNTVIPNSVTSIGTEAFYSLYYGANELTSITIPNSVTSIGTDAFGFCRSLTSVTIPNSVTSIGDYAFRYCLSLTDVYCYAKNVPETHSKAFDYSSIESATLYVPKGSVESYKATSPWSGFGTIEEIPSEANPDINADGNVDVADIMAIINLIATDTYLASADLNNDGSVDVGDIMGVINVMMGSYSYSAGVKAISTLTDTDPVTENNDYLIITNEDNIVSIQLDNEFGYSAFQMLVTLPDGVDIDAVTFNSDRLDGFTKFVKKVNEGQYIIIGFSMDGNVITGSTGKMLSLSTTGNADDDIIISDPIFSIPEAKPYKLRVADSYTTNMQDVQRAQISVRGNTLYVYANSDTTLNIYTISGALCEQKHLHSGVNAITLRRGQYIINNQKVTISK